jgi:hypothetical protein
MTNILDGNNLNTLAIPSPVVKLVVQAESILLVLPSSSLGCELSQTFHSPVKNIKINKFM